MILEELNVKELEILENAGDLADFVTLPNAKLLGPNMGKKFKNHTGSKSGNFRFWKTEKWWWRFHFRTQ